MVDGTRSAIALMASSRELLDTEQRIVDYVLANREEAQGMTCAQLARASGTSEATVSRFCKRLGFDSYRSFQFSLARDLTRRRGEARVTSEVSLENMGQSLTNILATKVSELTATIRGIDEDELRRVVDAIACARMVEVAAVGNTVPVALDAAFKFNQLGIRCDTSEISEKLSAMALTLGQGDALLMVSNSGKSRRLMRVARVARERGAKLLLITGSAGSPLARMADHKLLSVNHEGLLTTGDFAFSKISTIALIEVVYHFLLASIPGARENISRHEELMAPDKQVE